MVSFIKNFVFEQNSVEAVVFALLMGIVVGLIVSKFGEKETPYADKDEFILPK